MVEAPLYGYEYEASKKGETAVIRSKYSPTNFLVSKAYPEVETLYDCFQRGLRISRDEPCFGYRPLEEDGTLGDYVWYTYAETYEKIQNFGSGLIEKDLVHEKFGYKSIGVFCKNCVEWCITEHSCHAYQFTLIPIYDTLGNDSVTFILNQSELETIVCVTSTALKLASLLEKDHFLKNLIIIDKVTDKDKELLLKEGLTVYSFSEIEAIGEAHRKPVTPPGPDHIHTICYTSGTTGLPKGICISQKNTISCLSGCLYTGIAGRPTDRYLSYLPLAHVLERILHSAILIDGGRIGFYQGNTAKVLEDIKLLRPTVFCSVPRLLNKIYDGINAKIRAKGSLIYSIFKKGIETKTYNMDRYGTFRHYLYDILFNSIKKMTGLDQIRLVISGSASLSSEVLHFLRSFLGCPVVEGYGTSETTSATLLQVTDDFATCSVGGNLSCCEMKLINVDSMGYKVTDRMHNDTPCIARGEILIRGNNISTKFYRMDKPLLDEEGWFHTGDVGVLLPNYAVRIVDRVKNFFKLSQGEYVAAEKLEVIYSASEYISQCYIYGDSTRDYLIAIIVPEEGVLRKWWKKTHPENAEASFEDMCKSQDTKDFILSELKNIHAANKLRGFERIKKVHLDNIPWSDQNNMLTPTFKLKRNIAKEKYLDIINALYNSK